MGQVVETDGGTKARILAAASDVFTQKGFRKATIRDICSRAGANPAAVNYHFRDKRSLYTQVLRGWIENLNRSYPYHTPAVERQPAEARLRFFINAMLRRIFCGALEDREMWIRRTRIVLMELAEPSSGATLRVEEWCEEERYFRAIVAELLGDVPERVVHFTADSIVGQCIQYFLGIAHIPEEVVALAEEDNLAQLADHIIAFSLGGIRAIKELNQCR
ncbi:TetR/AcrR family transcriptional regulator [Desulfobaculum sp.]|jgi:AcrR family transcriptional regulator